MSESATNINELPVDPGISNASSNIVLETKEKNNIALDFPEMVNELRKKINKWNKKTIDPIFLGLSNNELYNKLNPDRFKF